MIMKRYRDKMLLGIAAGILLERNIVKIALKEGSYIVEINK